MKRKHQAETESVMNGIISGSGIKHTIVVATPGAGKSSVPIIGGKLVEAGLAEGLCWCVPRKELQDQGERGFLDPFFRNLFDHNLTIRSSTNELNPCRDTNGFVTTYQALGTDTRGITQQEFSRRRYVLVLDEYHHVEKDGIWHKAIEPLYRQAAYTILMTGTLERSNGKAIAYTPYEHSVNGMKPRLSGSEDTAIVRYTRKDALSEKAILPIRFFLSDGKFQWKNEAGAVRNADSFNAVRFKKEQSDALYTALNTGFAEQLLYDCVLHWSQHKRNHNPRAKLLVVAADYESAKKYTSLLGKFGVYGKIATSHKPKEASAAIKAFKTSSLDALVTIAMAYEGMDVPPVTHIAALTHIRSTPWIEQMVARAVRIDRQAGPYESQQAFVFAPEDAAFRAVVSRIEAEQTAVLKATEEKKKKEKRKSADDGGGAGVSITPIGSSVTGKKEFQVGCGPVQMSLFGGDPEPTERVPVILPETSSSIPVDIPEPRIETNREMETRLRKEIKNHINLFAFNNRYDPRKINSEIKIKMGKARSLMSVTELESLKKHLKSNYPLSMGSKLPPMDGVSPARAKRKRVPTKVVPWNGY